MKTYSQRSGFTLLELVVVLAIIGVILGSGLIVLTASVQTAQLNATVDKMNALDTALLNFRVAFNRLPCPADQTLTPTNANYGVEAGAGSGSLIATGAGACTGVGMAPQANWSGAASGGNTVAAGAVPTRALRLPDSAMYDGWGRRFHYAVDTTMTATSAFVNIPIYPAICSPTGISVTDASDVAASRTSTAVYALVSFGANGHGGYTSNGVPLNAGSLNSDELTNCQCNSSAVANTSYTPSYVQKLPTASFTSALYNFDDVVSYKTLQQLQTTTTNETSVSCPYLAVATDRTPYLTLYLNTSGTLTQLGTANSVPAALGGTTRLSFSNDNNYLVVTTYSTGNSYVYQVAQTGLTYLSSFSTLAQNGRLSPDSTFFLSAIDGTPPLGAWTRSGSSFSNTGVSITSSTNWASDVTTDGSTVYLLLGGNSHASNSLITYTRSGLTYTQANTTSLSGTTSTYYQSALDLDASGLYLAIGYQNGMLVLQNPSATSPATLGSYTGNATTALAWSPDDTLLAANLGCGGTTNSVQLYGLTLGTLSTGTVSGTTCSGACGGANGQLSWSKDSKFLVQANGKSGPAFCLFQRAGATLTAVSVSSGLQPSGNGLAAAFSK